MDPLLQKLTLAVPIYNDATYLERTLESIKDQAGQIILHDNASTDGSSEICAAFSAKNPNVKHIRMDENVGAFENFKRPLFNCTTEYFTWVGSHDKIGPDYSLNILRAFEQDPKAVLAVGQIQHIDEQDNNMRRRTDSSWVRGMEKMTPLERVAHYTLKLRDCFMWYGVFRTEAQRKAWFETPCLGFDRVHLVRAAALGHTLYVPESTFYARNFPNTRNDKEDRERRSVVIAHEKAKPLRKDNLMRNQMLVQIVLDQVQDYDDMSFALKIVDKINRRYQDRRFYQKRRLMMIIGGALFVILFVLGWLL